MMQASTEYPRTPGIGRTRKKRELKEGELLCYSTEERQPFWSLLYWVKIIFCNREYVQEEVSMTPGVRCTQWAYAPHADRLAEPRERRTRQVGPDDHFCHSINSHVFLTVLPIFRLSSPKRCTSAHVLELARPGGRRGARLFG